MALVAIRWAPNTAGLRDGELSCRDQVEASNAAALEILAYGGRTTRIRNTAWTDLERQSQH
ncbi:hypothetical protein ACWD7C_29165 [Streptomyces sp. NPDC005134]|uniref:hypothetical protein n=1 Tax=unclassified Streptomyces TaxID=2593676 RepID=UPI00339F3949